MSLDFRLIYFPPSRRGGVLVQSEDGHIDALHSLFDVMKLPVSLSCGCVNGNIDICIENKASVTIMADFSPEFNPPVRWRSKRQTKNDC